MTRLAALLLPLLVAVAAPGCSDPVRGVTDASPQPAWALASVSAQWELADPAGECSCFPDLPTLARYLDTVGTGFVPVGTAGSDNPNYSARTDAGTVLGRTLPLWRTTSEPRGLVLSDQGMVAASSGGIASARPAAGSFGSATFLRASVESRTPTDVFISSVWQVSLRFTDSHAFGRDMPAIAGPRFPAVLIATVRTHHVIQ
jgi:hypothetical protein